MASSVPPGSAAGSSTALAALFSAEKARIEALVGTQWAVYAQILQRMLRGADVEEEARGGPFCCAVQR